MDEELRLFCIRVKGDVDQEIATRAARLDWEEVRELAEKRGNKRWANRALAQIGIAAFYDGDSETASSLELGCEDGHLAGSCDSGLSCAYVNSISWRNATVPNPLEVNPRAVFERLFGSDENAGDPQLGLGPPDIS